MSQRLRRTSFCAADFNLRLEAPTFGASEGTAQTRDQHFSAYSFGALPKEYGARRVMNESSRSEKLDGCAQIHDHLRAYSSSYESKGIMDMSQTAGFVADS